MVMRVILMLMAFLCLPAQAQTIKESSAFAVIGEPKYAVNFTHFDYVNPAAPKGGNVTLSATGTFDNFNRYALRGVAAARTESLYDTLFVTSDDEPGSYYPLVADNVRYADDFAWAEVSINPRARFHNGTPVKASDIAFTFHKFMTEGVPQFRLVYKGTTIKAIAPLTVRIELSEPNKENMLSLFSLPVMPESFWKNHKLSDPLSVPPLAGGPYRITAWRMGQYLVYSRVKDLIRQNFPKKVHLKKEPQNEFSQDQRWVAFYFPPPVLADRRVREAITLAFDFEWMNKALFYGAYNRANSYFQNTEYAARDYPNADELVLLAPLKAELPPEVFTSVFTPPVSDGNGFDRDNLLKASRLLDAAGWPLKNQKRINAKTGKPLSFELLLSSGADNQWVMPFKQNLERLGVTLNIRQVDNAQITNRMRSRDYDMMQRLWSAQPWPSSDLQIAWASSYIDSSYNAPGVKSPAIDALIAKIIAAQGDKDKLLPLGRALDRVLTWNYYMLPMWYMGEDRTARWDKFSLPSVRPIYSLGFDTWWYDVNKAAKLPAERR